MSRRRERSAIQDVFFLYYEGQPRQYSPVKNEQNLLFQFLAATLTPADIQVAPLRSATDSPTREARPLLGACPGAVPRPRGLAGEPVDGFGSTAR
ncbi:MAG: hypothetical protein U0807_09235 [Candidatus Binatia bacterium]